MATPIPAKAVLEFTPRPRTLPARLAEFGRRAERDPLTGLANRGAFDERFSQVSGRAPISALLLVDLDGFKDINDTHGHAVGDLCLQRSVRTLGQRINAALGCPIEHGGRRLQVSASVGIAYGQTGSGADVPAELFARADAALYAAKAAGRNTVRIDGDQPRTVAARMRTTRQIT
jgi:GGDEF domain-containing protein